MKHYLPKYDLKYNTKKLTGLRLNIGEFQAFQQKD